MRALTLPCFGFAFLLAGCCASHESPTNAKGECKDCACTTLSRANLQEDSSDKEADSAVTLKTVKFDAFTKEVKDQKGKVVAAYLWTHASAPSKKNLPVIIELQRKLAKDGLVAITVSSDSAKTSKDALEHLEQTKCALVNYRQDDNDTVEGWTKCFGCCGFPILVIYGRDGKQAATFEVTELPFDAAVIEKTLVKLLQAK